MVVAGEERRLLLCLAAVRGWWRSAELHRCALEYDIHRSARDALPDTSLMRVAVQWLGAMQLVFVVSHVDGSALLAKFGTEVRWRPRSDDKVSD